MGTVKINESSASKHPAKETPVFSLAASQTPEKLYESAESQSAFSSNSVMSSNTLKIHAAMEAPHGALSSDAQRVAVTSKPLSYEGCEHYATARGGEGES